MSKYMVVLSSALIVIFSVIFTHQLKELKKRSFVAEPNPLLLKILSMMHHIYRNSASSFIALTRLDDTRQVLPPQLRSLAQKLSLGHDVRTMASDLPLLDMGFSDSSTQDRWKTNEFLFKEVVRDLRKRLFTSNIRNIITLVLTGIIITPVIAIISAFFHQEGALELLPIVISLFYGITLQLIIVILKRYASILV